MTPRPLELLDLPKLANYRGNLILLDSRQGLTWGNPLQATGFLAYLNPTRRIYTAIHHKKEHDSLISGIIQRADERFARLTYFAPKTIDIGEPLALLEHLCVQAGKWGAHQVVAEVEEGHPLFQSLRRVGFSVASRQRIWRMNEFKFDEELPVKWRKEEGQDQLAIQRLQREITPPLLLQIEQSTHPATGMVYDAETVQAYIHVDQGPQGIFLRPLIHPNVDDIDFKLRSFFQHLPNRRGVSVYISLRTHQAWIGSALEEIGASAGESQAVMVKHLAHVSRQEKPIPASGDRAWANPATPISGNSSSLPIKPSDE